MESSWSETSNRVAVPATTVADNRPEQSEHATGARKPKLSAQKSGSFQFSCVEPAGDHKKCEINHISVLK